METLYDSPIGPLRIMAKDGFITGVFFSDKTAGALPPPPRKLLKKLDQNFNKEAAHEAASLDGELVKKCIEELEEYFAGRLKVFTVPVKAEGTPFRMKVWEALRGITYGETISYKELAQRIGQPSAIRAVGGANHHNPVSIIIPCHRVIGAGGKLVGYGGGMEVKEFLLKHEEMLSK